MDKLLNMHVSTGSSNTCICIQQEETKDGTCMQCSKSVHDVCMSLTHNIENTETNEHFMTTLYKDVRDIWSEKKCMYM